MGRMKTGKPVGRPKIEIDKLLFENLCQIQCTKSEIASVLMIDDDTVSRWCNDTYGANFSVIYKKYAESGKMSLRRYQFKMAQTNATMAIWLGKQYLGQSDKNEITNITPDTEIKIEIINDKSQLAKKNEP